MTLYELKENYRAVLDMMEDEDVDQGAILTTLEAISDTIDVKAENYAIVIKELQAEAEKLKKEEERLKRRRQTIENNINTMKLNLQEAMVLTDKRKIKTEHFTIGIQKNGGALPVHIDNEDALPERFKVYTWKPDTEQLRNYLEIMGTQSFAHLGERGESLRIR